MASDAPSSPYQDSILQSDLDIVPDDDATSPLDPEGSVDEVTFEEDFDMDIGALDLNAEIIQKLKSAGLFTQHEVLSKLCHYCANITHEAISTPESYKHTPNVWKLLQSAEECELCALVVEQITADGAIFLDMDFEGGERERNRDEEFETSLMYLGISRDEPRPVRVELRSHGMAFQVDKGADEAEWMRWHRLVELKAFTDSSTHSQREGSDLPLRLALTEQPSLEILSVLIREWIASCQQSHRRCNFPSQGDAIPRLPTRVLDLRDVKSKGRVRIWPTQGSRARYIALSHCWGGKQPVKTEKGNLSQRIEGFPYTDLPPLFRDAVDTALAIGIDYLWIDSLCIVQDDKEDWAFEAARMADVYMNSSLTIAASAAPNSSGRLLGPRQTAPKAVRIPQRAASSTEENWSIYVDGLQERFFSRDAHGSPLNKRAWVLQERLLSPRTLHFTGTQVYWECWRDIQHESLQYEMGDYHKSRVFPGSLSPCKLGAKDKVGAYLEQWFKVLEIYTGCQLTFASDKLIAISGIVDRIQSGDTNPCFKGIFYDSALHQQLLWIVDDNSRCEFLPETGAPSWSWASRNGKIHFSANMPGLEPHNSTRVAWRENSEDQILDLRADLFTLDASVIVGELREKERVDSYRRKQGVVARNLLMVEDGDIHFRFIHEDRSAIAEDDDADNDDSRSDGSGWVPKFTGLEDESDFEDDDTVAGVLLDREKGGELNFGSIFWVLVGHVPYVLTQTLIC
ncbi:heterokaryon incompatibility protein [Diplodia corticola]|uniref:Heterokaryon incompatibility protein n=1 Tax=Diplodia corticola TaxID=236234 RepID=A0A1J9RY86_9PEZI|nr:heterokaryon incompatibility protein [Diplodia corticola]OJD33311.1 heterokaryon incompatibility protein [Diplodia corticola]